MGANECERCRQRTGDVVVRVDARFVSVGGAPIMAVPFPASPRALCSICWQELLLFLSPSEPPLAAGGAGGHR